MEEGKWGWTNYVISCTLAYGSYDILLVHVNHTHAHVFMSSVTFNTKSCTVTGCTQEKLYSLSVIINTCRMLTGEEI